MRSPISISQPVASTGPVMTAPPPKPPTPNPAQLRDNPDGGDDPADTTNERDLGAPPAAPTPAGELVGPPQQISSPPISIAGPQDGANSQDPTPSEQGGTTDRGNLNAPADRQLALTGPSGPTGPASTGQGMLPPRLSAAGQQGFRTAQRRKRVRAEIVSLYPPDIDARAFAVQILQAVPQLAQPQFEKPVMAVARDLASLINSVRKINAVQGYSPTADDEQRIQNDIVNGLKGDAERAYSRLQQKGVI